jgi:MYXO-CTERM domain-containing protein
MTDPVGGEPGAGASADDIKADIEATRHELGETVEALTARLDVKQQAKQKVDDTKKSIAESADSLLAKGSEVGAQVAEVATDDQGTVRPVVPVAAMALLAVVVGIILWRRRR